MDGLVGENVQDCRSLSNDSNDDKSFRHLVRKYLQARSVSKNIAVRIPGVPIFLHTTFVVVERCLQIRGDIQLAPVGVSTTSRVSHRNREHKQPACYRGGLLLVGLCGFA